MNKPALVFACVVTLAGCKSKLEKCNHVCDELQAEHSAKCSDATCRESALGAYQACKDLCWTVAAGKPATPGGAHAGAEDNCAKGTAEACVEAGGMYLLGRGATKDEVKARGYFDRACKLGSAFGCETLGKMMRDGRGGPADNAGAIALLRRACDDNAAGACTSVGLDAMKHGDKAAAVRLLTKACDGNDKIGCTGLGALYLHGNGVRKDVKRAKELLSKACALGDQAACSHLARR